MRQIETNYRLSFSDDMALWSPSHVDCIASELFNGRGILLVRGLQTNGISTEQHIQMCKNLGSAIGSLVPQDADGNLVRKIKSSMSNAKDLDLSLKALGSRGNHRMALHSDSADIVGLFCLSRASRGGTSYVACSSSIYRRYIEEFPDLVSELRRGFHFDMTGKTTDAPPITRQLIPVFDVNGNNFVCTYNRKRIEDGARHLGQKLTCRQIAALDAFDAISESKEHSLGLLLSEGDLLFLNNRLTLHGRDEFIDIGAEQQRRFLLRFWVNRN